MKIKGLLFITIIITLLLLCVSVYAEDVHLDLLDIDAQLFENGDMSVKETWHVSFSDAEIHVGFKNIPLKGFIIEDISVSSGDQAFVYAEYPFSRQDINYIGQEGTYTYYTHNGDLWIEWYIDEYDSKKQYTISYTIKDIVTVYKDTAELYWKFIGSDFELGIERVTGKISIPKGADMDNFLVWAHGPLNGSIKRVDSSLTEFSAKNLSNDMLEVRLAMPTKLFPESKNQEDFNYLDIILAEEQEWADAANRERRMMLILGYIDVILGLIFLLAAIVIIVVLKRRYKKHVPVDDVEYYRDVPDRTMTPAVASHLYYFYNKNNKQRGYNFSASILELARRKYIYFDELTEKDKKVITIVINKEINLEDLEPDLKSIYDLILSAAGTDGYITLKKLQKYTSKNAARVKECIDGMDTNAKVRFEQRKLFDRKSDLAKNVVLFISFFTLFIAFFILLVLNSIFLYAPIGVMIGSLICLLFSFGIKRLNEEGEQQYKYWVGFGKFIEDFSMMKSYEIPKLIMWEEYMVYATMMGKADKAAKQLKLVYKELSDPEAYNMYPGSYLFYFLYFNSGRSFDSFNTFTNTLSNISNTATRIASNSESSSGKGYGGGFSGGGGGGFGGGGGGFR